MVKYIIMVLNHVKKMVLLNSLTKIKQEKWIKKVYKYYNKKMPFIKYNKKEIKKQFEYLQEKQNILFNENNFEDIDFKKNYLNCCILSDYYQNEERMNCCVNKYETPFNYYKKNYEKILHSYFSELTNFYEDGLEIINIDFNNPENSLNVILLQHIIYTKNKFCTVFKPYIFKFFIEFYNAKNILDLSSGWGDRLLGVLAIENKINKYIGIDPNKNLFNGYNKMITDLSNDKNKYVLINDKSENVEFIELESVDLIFWSPPFFTQEVYVTDKNRDDLKNQSIENFNSYESWEENFLIYTINKSVNNLKQHGILILYLGNIKYKTFLHKMNMCKKIKFLHNKHWINGTNIKNYIIYEKIEPILFCIKLKNINNDLIKKIKNKFNENINPPVKIENIKINNKNFNLIQECNLVAGTKERVAELFLKTKINNFSECVVYCGSYNGYGAVATAFASYKLGLKCKVFLSMIGTGFFEKTDIEKIKNTKQINTLMALDAEIYLCNNHRDAQNLKYDYSSIFKINGYETKKEYVILPMGLNDEKGEMINILSKQFSKSLIIGQTGNIWLVAGSGGILMALHKTLSNFKFFVYLTGGGKYKKNVINYSKKYKNISIVNNFKINPLKNIFYKSVENYDDKIIPFIAEYGNENDFIWNVACD